MINTNQSYVKVLIWEGTSSQKIGSSHFTPSLGHAALELFQENISRYISFWPGNCNTTLCTKNVSHFHTFDTDLKYEQRPPEHTHTLTTLDVKKINDWYEAHENNFSWVYHGSSKVKGPYEFNCAGLTYRLLQEGGLQKIVADQSTQNVKRILAATTFSSIAFGLAYYWSHHALNPLLQSRKILIPYAQQFESFGTAITNIFDTLKIIYHHVVSGMVAFTNVYDSELEGYTHLKTSLFPVYQAMKTDIVATTPNFPMLYTGPFKLLKGKLFEFVAGYSPFLSIGVFVSLANLMGGVTFVFLNNKIVLETITPTDVSNLVLQAVEKEGNVLKQRKFSQKPINLVVYGLMIASINYYSIKKEAIAT